LFVWKQPRINDGQVGRDDGEEEEKDSNNLRNMEAVVHLEKIG
jgi:hypothetical protein